MITRVAGACHGGAIIGDVRLFYCLELPAVVRDVLTRLSSGLQARVRGGTWVAPENLHITLRFLGEVGEDLVPPLEGVGREAAAQGEPFDLPLDRLGAFPHPARARVLWVGPVKDSAPFAILSQTIEDGVQALGFPPERRLAHPHVTLARLRIPQDLAFVIGGTAPPFLQARVDALTLMRSELRSQGPLYRPVVRWPLGGGDRAV